MLSANPQMVHKLAQLYGKKMINNMARKKSNDAEHDMDLMTFFSTLMEMTIKKDDPPEEDECSDCESVSDISAASFDRTRYFSVSDHTSIAHLLVSEELRLKQSMLREKEEFKKQRQAQKDKQKLKRESEENEKQKLKELELLEKQRKELELQRELEEQEEHDRRKISARCKMENNARKWLFHYADSAKPRFIDLIRLSSEFDEIPTSKLYELEYKFDPSRESDAADIHYNLVDGIGAHVFDLNRYESQLGRQETPLHSAIRGGLKCFDWTIVKFLLELNDVDYSIPDSDGMIPLHLGIHLDAPEPILLKLIENSGPLIDERDAKTGATALHIAALKGNARCVKMLLSHKARFNVLNLDSQTAENVAEGSLKRNKSNDRTDWNKLDISSLPAKCGTASSFAACACLLKKCREQSEIDKIELLLRKKELKEQELEYKRLQEVKDEEARRKAAQKVKTMDDSSFTLTPAFLDKTPQKKKKKTKKRSKKTANSVAIDDSSVASSYVEDMDRSRSTSNDSLAFLKTANKPVSPEVSAPPGFTSGPLTAAELERELLQFNKSPQKSKEATEPHIDNSFDMEHFLSKSANSAPKGFVKNNLKSHKMELPAIVVDEDFDVAPGFEPALQPVGSMLLNSILEVTEEVEENKLEINPGLIGYKRPKNDSFSLFNDNKPLFGSIWGPTKTNGDWLSNNK